MTKTTISTVFVNTNCADRNTYYSNPAYTPKLIIDVRNEKGRKATLTFKLARDSSTGKIEAIIPRGNSKLGLDNAKALHSLGVSDYSQVLPLLDEFLSGFITDDDSAARALNGVYEELEHMREAYCNGRAYDGEDFDPTDDFHRFLIDNNLASAVVDSDIDDEENPDIGAPGEVLQLCEDFDDELTDFINNYFIDMSVAYTEDKRSHCVELMICTGGPSMWLQDLWSHGYTLFYRWGSIYESMGVAGYIDDFINEFFGIDC